MKHSILSLFLILTLSSCAITQPQLGQITEIERTWKFAQTVLPAKYSTMEMNHLAPGFYEYQLLDDWSRDIKEKHFKKNVDKVPVVLHMHGCTGIQGADGGWAHNYADMGYLTIMPNSFKRPNRRSMCDSRNWLYRSQLRIEEIDYAIEQVLKIPWVDQNKIFLSGFSEGGNTLSFYTGEKFQAYIIIGTNCKHAGGIRAPKNIPVLNIVGQLDHYPGYGEGCNVNRSIGGSRRVIVRGAGHDVSNEDEARRAAREFLENCCKR